MPLRVLIADQRSDQIMPLVEFLIARGIHPVTCNHGGDAVDAIGVQLADEQPFDLVIAHVDLPEIAGLRVLYEARRLNLSTAAALICPKHRLDEKVQTMIRKTGVMAVFEQHIDLARMDRVLKKVVAIRKQEATRAKARAREAAERQVRQQAADKAAEEAQRREQVKREPLIESFGSQSGARAMAFNPYDEVEDPSLPPIDGVGGPPSAPTGIHRVLPPSEGKDPTPTFTAKLPPREPTSLSLQPVDRSPPRGQSVTPAKGGAPAPPGDASASGPQRRRSVTGAPPATGRQTGTQRLTVTCFRCGHQLKVKPGTGVISVPCGNCGVVNDVKA